MGSHSDTCQPTQVNTSCQTSRYSMRRRDGPSWLVTRPQTVTRPNANPTKHGREFNSQPVDHKSDALTTTLLSHQDVRGWLRREFDFVHRVCSAVPLQNACEMLAERLKPYRENNPDASWRELVRLVMPYYNVSTINRACVHIILDGSWQMPRFCNTVK